MIGKRTRILALGVLALSMLFMGVAGCGNSESGEKTGMEDVRKEAGEAAEAMKDYAGQQKDKFFGEAEAALERIDDRIASFKRTLDEKWDEMDQQARKQAEQTLETLTEKRELLAQRLKNLKESSADAWEKMKKEFWDSFESLKDSLDQNKTEIKYI